MEPALVVEIWLQFPALPIKWHKKRSPLPVGSEPLRLAVTFYLALRPNSVAFGSNAFSNGPAIAAIPADASAFGSVTPARYKAITDATPARRYVAAIAFNLFLSIVTPLDLLVLSSLVVA